MSASLILSSITATSLRTIPWFGAHDTTGEGGLLVPEEGVEPTRP